MNIGTYSLTKKEALLWLVSAAVMVAFISLGIFLHGKILNDTHDKQRLYQTAIKTKNGEEFNYSIDTRQGNILTYGTFHFVDFVKFPEMTKEFSQVIKTEEEYNRHEREVCETHYETETQYETVTDDEGNTTTEAVEVEVPVEECHTEEYYEWDYNGSETLEGQKVKLYEREYPSSMFAYGSSRGINASEIVNGATGQYWYKNGDKGEGFFGIGGASVGDLRYRYDVRDASVSGSIFVNTSQGFMKAVEGNIIRVHRESIEERVEKINTEAAWASGGFIALWVILTIGATIGVTALWHEKVNY